MPRGDKGKYTSKQKRQAEHIEEGYEDRGLSEDEAERRAWATVNKTTGGGKKPGGSGRGKKVNKVSSKKGGKKGGKKAGKKGAKQGGKKAKRASSTKKSSARNKSSGGRTKRKTAKKKSRS